MALHYKKDGSLDMRYSSSRQAVASGYSSGYHHPSFSSHSSYGGGSTGYQPSFSSHSSYGGGSSGYSSSGSDLHYKKDGSLDMRYASSKQAVACGGSSASYGGTPSRGYSAGSSDLHYKKDGSLDMRYSSSKQAMGHAAPVPPRSSDLHYKKDGSLDMRYSSSKQAAALGDCLGRVHLTAPPSSSSIHHKKDGSLDMRYSSSKVAHSASGTYSHHAKQSGRNAYNIPDYVPRKKDGTPDMRTRAAKEWVASQANNNRGGYLPNWVPQKKDGSVDMTSAVGRAFAVANQSNVSSKREDYWRNRMMDDLFAEVMTRQREEYVPEPIPQPVQQISISHTIYNYHPTEHAPVSQNSQCRPDMSFDKGFASIVPDSIPQIDYHSITFETAGDDDGVLGRGAFGIVKRASWQGRNVAVKQLHLDRLSKKEKESFHTELLILANLGNHRNLIKLFAYCVNPPCIVMELISLGSLTHLLHYNEDPVVEAKMSDGRIKKKIVFGIADGMRQLHATMIVHGDLKPQNILVTDDYEAKVTDFGLSTLRGKTSSTVASKQFDDSDGEACVIGGTAGYMAPELLDSTSPADFPSDVYSFGILLNEVVAEEEPYSDQYANFAGRGPFGAVNYAKQGKRPTVCRKTPKAVEDLIESCWAEDPTVRPSFDEILVVINKPAFKIPNLI